MASTTSKLNERTPPSLKCPSPAVTLNEYEPGVILTFSVLTTYASVGFPSSSTFSLIGLNSTPGGNSFGFIKAFSLLRTTFPKICSLLDVGIETTPLFASTYSLFASNRVSAVVKALDTPPLSLAPEIEFS